MADSTSKDVLLKNKDGEYLLPYNGAVKSINGATPDSNGAITITPDLSSCAKLNAANQFNGEQVFINRDYCPTMLDIATGIGCAFKGTRACFDQSIVGQIILPTTSAVDATFSADITSGRIKVQYISAAVASNPALVTIGYFDANGWNGRATQDGQGNVIPDTYLTKTTASSTYLTKTSASSTYLGKTAKAASAKTADTATKATQDGNGNVISSTYLTKTDASSTYAKKADVTTITSGTADLTAGSSALATGALYFVYE